MTWLGQCQYRTTIFYFCNCQKTKLIWENMLLRVVLSGVQAGAPYSLVCLEFYRLVGTFDRLCFLIKCREEYNSVSDMVSARTTLLNWGWRRRGCFVLTTTSHTRKFKTFKRRKGRMGIEEFNPNAMGLFTSTDLRWSFGRCRCWNFAAAAFSKESRERESNYCRSKALLSIGQR